MNYNKLQSIIPNDELHYTADSECFFNDNELSMPTDYEYIVFSETTDYFPATIQALVDNNIEHVVLTDEWNLDYILIK